MLRLNNGLNRGNIKVSLSGINKKCQQCDKQCKQWSQVRVVYCPWFRSTQQGEPLHRVKALERASRQRNNNKHSKGLLDQGGGNG